MPSIPTQSLHMVGVIIRVFFLYSLAYYCVEINTSPPVSCVCIAMTELCERSSPIGEPGAKGINAFYVFRADDRQPLPLHYF